MFIYTTEGDLKKAFDRMVKYIKWYNNTFPLNISTRRYSNKIIKLRLCICLWKRSSFPSFINCTTVYYTKMVK